MKVIAFKQIQDGRLDVYFQTEHFGYLAPIDDTGVYHFIGSQQAILLASDLKQIIAKLEDLNQQPPEDVDTTKLRADVIVMDFATACRKLQWQLPRSKAYMRCPKNYDDMPVFVASTPFVSSIVGKYRSKGKRVIEARGDEEVFYHPLEVKRATD